MTNSSLFLIPYPDPPLENDLWFESHYDNLFLSTQMLCKMINSLQSFTSVILRMNSLMQSISTIGLSTTPLLMWRNLSTKVRLILSGHLLQQKTMTLWSGPVGQWIELIKHTHQFANTVPSLELPDYTTHLGSLHQIVSDDALHRQFNVFLTEPFGPGTPGLVNPTIQLPSTS